MERQIAEIQHLATKYSKADLGRMVQMGLIDPQKAMMAGMMIARIQQQNAQPPQTTVAQEVLGLPAVAPQAPPQQAQQAQPQAPQGVAALPQQAQPSAGIEALPAGSVGEYAEGGIVAFDDGGIVYDPMTGLPISGATGGDDYTAAERFGMLFDSNYKPYRDPRKQAAPAPKAPAAPKKDEVVNPLADQTPTKPTAKLPPIARPKEKTLPPVGVTAPRDPLAGYNVDIPVETAGTPEAKDAEKAGAERAAREKAVGYDPEMYNKIIQGIESKKGDAATEKDRMLGEAIMQAGFKLMGARKGQEFQNLSEGAQEGLKTYQTAMKEFKARQDKLDERMDAFRIADAQARRTGAESDIARADKNAELVQKAKEQAAEAKNRAAVAGTQAAVTMRDTDIRALTSERVAQLQAQTSREYTAALKAQQLDATKAKILIDAAGDFINKNAQNPAYLRDPAKLQSDAIAYAQSLGATMGVMPKGATSAPPPSSVFDPKRAAQKYGITLPGAGD